MEEEEGGGGGRLASREIALLRRKENGGENKLKAKLYSHKKMELFLDAVPPRYEEKEVGGKVVRDGFGLHCARRKNRKRWGWGFNWGVSGMV